MKNHAVVGIKANKKNLKENVSRTPDNQQVVARTRILTPMYQPPNVAKIKARLYMDEQGLYLLEYFGEKHLSSCCDDVDAPKVTAAWVAAWAAELTTLSNYTFHAILAIQSREVALTFEAATSKLMVMARSKIQLANNKKMMRLALRLPKKSTRSSKAK